MADDFKLHNLCHEGNLEKVIEFVRRQNKDVLAEALSTRKGIFGYTPLHEAASRGNAQVLNYLLENSPNRRSIVNFEARGGYTPLHLAASSGHEECVKKLLEHSADIFIKDEYGKTPKQAAKLGLKSKIVQILQCEEVVKEVEAGGEKLDILLSRVNKLEQDCLNRALKAATRNDDHSNISKLVERGAANIDECIYVAQRENKPHAHAILLLTKAAMYGSMHAIQRLFEEPNAMPDNSLDDGFHAVQMAFRSGVVSSKTPLEIAHRAKNNQVYEEILVRTDINKEEGYVYWDQLKLYHLDASWLMRISWVKKLSLAENGFNTLPDTIGDYLKSVVKIDLQHNDLFTIPQGLLKLPNLKDLNLSHNRLMEIPATPKWSPCLSVLDLSHNQLSSLPIEVDVPRMHSLDLRHNNFHSVPLCVCSMTTLCSLKLSDNPDIAALPVQMGRLNKLECLELNNLINLSDPPKSLHKNPHQCIEHLYKKLYHKRRFYSMKLMVLGLAKRGKTTLVKRLRGKEYEHAAVRSGVGIEIKEWSFTPNRFTKTSFQFRIWDFTGQEKYYAAYHCFLSPRSFCLLLFNLNGGEDEVKKLKPWLSNIAHRAPNSHVIIIGTHLDQVTEEKREEVDTLLQRVGYLAEAFHDRIQIVQVIPVALKNQVENIGLLREAIYNHASNYKTTTGENAMGQMVPASYHALDRHLLEMRREQRVPIMDIKDFRTMIRQMNLTDIQSRDELNAAAHFLTNVGSLLHIDDCNHNLHNLFFVDLQWLINIISKITNAEIIDPSTTKGILHSKHIPQLLEDTVPWKYYEQLITLLDHFEVALPLNNKWMLIPSMLSDTRPPSFSKEVFENIPPMYSRCFLFGRAAATLPPTFWSRFLSLVVHSIPQVSSALDKFISPTPTNELSLQSQVQEEFDFSLSMHGTATSLYSQLEGIISPPLTLPNFQAALPTQVGKSYEMDEIQLEYWHGGLYYHDPSLTLFVEPLAHSSRVQQGTDKEGILVLASPHEKIIPQLVNLVTFLAEKWYPFLTTSGEHSSHILEQVVPCFECMKVNRPRPFEFEIERYISAVLNKQKLVDCEFNTNEPSKNHTVLLSDIVPDILLMDIGSDLLLDTTDTSFHEDDTSLLGKGNYGRVYRGKYHNKHVAIKKYWNCDEKAIFQLRHEAKLLQECKHPCIVNLLGVHLSTVALVLEEAPLSSLESLFINKKVSVNRQIIFQIAAEVASALQFLHSKGITFCGLEAANVLLWTLSPASLCHCKITGFGTAAHMGPMGARGHNGNRNFLAPEILHVSPQNEYSGYNNKADIFSFGMFLYQMIARRHPYHDIAPQNVQSLIEGGKRPKLQDISVATTDFHYLTMLMKKCWEDDPNYRPSASEIIKILCLCSVESIMCVFPLKSAFSLRTGIGLTHASLTNVFPSKQHNEVWLSCDGVDGIELNVYDCNMMVQVRRHFIKHYQVCYMTLSHNHIWVGSRNDDDCRLFIFNATSHDFVRSISMRDTSSISCLIASGDGVLVGTYEGCCFSFSNSDISRLHEQVTPKQVFSHEVESAIEGIVSTEELIWLSHNKHIHLINPQTSTVERIINRARGQDVFIGQLFVSPAEDLVWSAHLNHGTILSAWDIHKRTHSFDINTKELMNSKTTDQNNENDLVITAMIPVLDTVWIGMATGHIMVFHLEDLLTIFHPYDEHVRFLSVIPNAGPCEIDKCVVISGGKGFRSQVKGLGPDYNQLDNMGQPQGKKGILVFWEAFEAKRVQQMKLVEENAPGFFDTYDSIRQMIHRGNFEDGTGITKGTEEKGSKRRTFANL